ncbi:glycosyltransferase family 2 protein [Devosia geojensis]|uniref:glycosyltransferase family 2 protein n=1 Tax=Devosia geojensis TaxID=443610 RepID=UPI001FCD2A69|nr:glycosyltransferase [Devosia geojensis]
MLPTVDVVIPCYCYGRFLRECVQSMLEQADVAVRVLIIDDASPDGSGEIARDIALGDPRVTTLVHASNRGHIATYNEGMDWAEADCFLLLSADDYLLPGALARAAGHIAADGAIAFCFGNAQLLDIDGHATPIRPLPKARADTVLEGIRFIELSGASNIVPTPTAVVRTAMQKAAGHYRPELHHSGDMEMWLRLAALGRVAFVNADQAVYRRHAANMSLWTADAALPELRQREAAIEAFILNCKAAAARSHAVQLRFDRALGQEALRMAHIAFNAGEMAACQEITAYARQIDPGIEWSLPFLKLSTKRAIGPTAWRRLASARRMMSPRHP